MKLTFKEEEEDQGCFGLTVQLRDSRGELTGKTKTFSSDDAFKLWQFSMRYKQKPKKRSGKGKGKGKNQSNEQLPQGKDADKLALQIAEEAENKQNT